MHENTNRENLNCITLTYLLCKCDGRNNYYKIARLGLYSAPSLCPCNSPNFSSPNSISPNSNSRVRVRVRVRRFGIRRIEFRRIEIRRNEKEPLPQTSRFTSTGTGSPFPCTPVEPVINYSAVNHLFCVEFEVLKFGFWSILRQQKSCQNCQLT